MEPDLALTLGLVLAALSIPSVFSALSDRRAPSLSLGMILAGLALIVYAVVAKPGGYSLSELPDVIVHVIARFMP